MPLFDSAISQLNPNKQNLIQWLEFYHNIDQLEQKEKPQQSIVEEDVLLDRWLEQHFHKKKLENIRARRGKTSKNHDEIITFGN